MSSDLALKTEGLSKCYHIYQKPRDRLFQMLTRGRKRYFREFWALKDISIGIQRGETVGIIGRNGSGKSTLLQLICGTLNPSEGEIQVNGRVAALLELGAGFNPEFSGRENVFMAGALYGLTSTQLAARFDKILQFADIGEFIDQPVKTYSSGMYVRLAFAVIAHVDAEILIIDEALAVGDAFFTQKCMRFLRSFMTSGTVLFVSHDTNAVVSLCTRALWLDKGRLLAFGDSKTLCEQYLEAIYSERHGSENKVPREQSGRIAAALNSEQKVPRDQRADFVNTSTLRNDLEIFQFHPTAKSFGLGGATFENAFFCDDDGAQFVWVVGGENVCLNIAVRCLVAMAHPIVGFLVRDRLGQNLFGDNTFLTTMQRPVETQAGERLVASFRFRMPILPAGDYSITVAVANGTQEDHVVHHWVHDAIMFKSHASSVSTGLVGIPMQEISLMCSSE